MNNGNTQAHQRHNKKTSSMKRLVSPSNITHVAKRTQPGRWPMGTCGKLMRGRVQYIQKLAGGTCSNTAKLQDTKLSTIYPVGVVCSSLWMMCCPVTNPVPHRLDKACGSPALRPSVALALCRASHARARTRRSPALQFCNVRTCAWCGCASDPTSR